MPAPFKPDTFYTRREWSESHTQKGNSTAQGHQQGCVLVEPAPRGQLCLSLVLGCAPVTKRRPKGWGCRHSCWEPALSAWTSGCQAVPTMNIRHSLQGRAPPGWPSPPHFPTSLEASRVSPPMQQWGEVLCPPSWGSAMGPVLQSRQVVGPCPESWDFLPPEK